MNLSDFFQRLSDSAIGTAIHESPTLFPWIESTHVLMIVTVVGTIAIVDLRLIGYPAHRKGARQLILDMLPFTWAAFACAVITGGLLFTSQAGMYWESTPFKCKMVALALAGINMAIFHLTAYRKIGDWDDRLPTPLGARIAGATSLCLWITVIFFGRLIGFSAPFV